MMPSSTQATCARSTISLQSTYQSSWGQRAAHWVFSIPQTVEDSLTKNDTAPLSRGGKILNNIIKTIGNFDHCTQRQLGPFKVMVPSKGAFFFLVVPLTVIPRVYQAFNREDSRFKWTELGDILRRDMLTLFSLLYAFGPFQSWLTRLAGNARGITLQDPLTGSVYQSSDTHRLYTLNESDDVVRILKPLQGSSHGLVQEASLVKETLKEGNKGLRWVETKMATLGQHPDLIAAKEALTHLVNTVLPNLSKESSLDKKADTLMEAISKAESHMSHWADEAPRLRSVLAHTADATRTPVSVASFLLVCGLIGVAPDVFNKLWNQRRFARLKQEHLQAQGEAVLRHLNPTPQALTPLMPSLSGRQIRA